MSASAVNGVLVKRKARLMESYKKMVNQLGIDGEQLAEDEALVMGQMAIEIAKIEAQLQGQIATAMRVLKLKMYVQLTFSFLYECELDEDEIPF